MSGIGVNLRVTGHCSQGGRKYMEDTFSVAYQQTEDLKDLEYAYFGIFDGHGGPEAALYAKDHLIDSIVSQSCFWSTNDDDVLRAIRDGYIQTHYTMWKHHESWPRTASGLPSTSGTTATVAFIKRSKIYVGHVGDSCIVLGYQEKGEKAWKAKPLTIDHKPETRLEIDRIMECGGKVVTKSGVPRVVWNRPRLGHKGPVRRSTHIDEIPFLAVARALGDFWSYNSTSNKFVVSPEPDVNVYPVDVESFRCLILGTDGLWNMLSPAVAVAIVQATENHNKKQDIYPSDQFVMQYNKEWLNPSKMLVDKAVKRWAMAKQRADNTSVVTLMLDPPGPPKTQLLVNQKHTLMIKEDELQTSIFSDHNAYRQDTSYCSRLHSSTPNLNPSSGVAIFTRYPTMDINQESGLYSPATYHNSSNGLRNAESSLNSNLRVLIDRSDNFKIDVGSEHSVLSHSRNEINDSVQVNDTSSSFQDSLDVTIVNTTPQTSSSPNSCDKRKHIGTNLITDSYNFRLKQKLRLPEKEEERMSDVENIEQFSQRWKDTPSSSSQSSLRKSKSKRRKYSFEQPNKDINWRCLSAPVSLVSSDKHLNSKSTKPQETTTRILRSDTLANTPVRTLRSRNIDLTTVINKPKTEDPKATKVLSKSCLQRSVSPKAKCVRSSSYSCPSNKKLTRMSSFSASSSITTRRSASKRIIK